MNQSPVRHEQEAAAEKARVCFRKWPTGGVSGELMLTAWLPNGFQGTEFYRGKSLVMVARESGSQSAWWSLLIGWSYDKCIWRCGQPWHCLSGFTALLGLKLKPTED